MTRHRLDPAAFLRFVFVAAIASLFFVLSYSSKSSSRVLFAALSLFAWIWLIWHLISQFRCPVVGSRTGVRRLVVLLRYRDSFYVGRELGVVMPIDIANQNISEEVGRILGSVLPELLLLPLDLTEMRSTSSHKDVLAEVELPLPIVHVIQKIPGIKRIEADDLLTQNNVLSVFLRDYFRSKFESCRPVSARFPRRNARSARVLVEDESNDPIYK